MGPGGRNEFGRRLRELREGTAPEALGLRSGSRRRVPGLRREELAALSNLSADYLTRLEQGHATRPSAEVVASLTRALRLPRLELELLHQLAGLAAPSDIEVPRHLAPGVSRLIDRLGDVPLAAYDAAWTMRSCNTAWSRLMGATASGPGFNLARSLFASPAAGASPTPHSIDPTDLHRALVADLRVTAARYPADVELRTLVHELHGTSPAFVTMWAEGRAAHFATERKQLRHPAQGEISLDCDILIAPDGDTRIVFYTAPPGSAADAALQAIASAAPS